MREAILNADVQAGLRAADAVDSSVLQACFSDAKVSYPFVSSESPLDNGYVYPPHKAYTATSETAGHFRTMKGFVYLRTTWKLPSPLSTLHMCGRAGPAATVPAEEAGACGGAAAQLLQRGSW